MKLLLDTCMFLWGMGDSDKLSSRALNAIRSSKARVHLSAASAWEISVNRPMGRLNLPAPTKDFIPNACTNQDISLLPISPLEAMAAGELPQHHKDPFDRMLIALAMGEADMLLVSPDQAFRAYDVNLLW